MGEMRVRRGTAARGILTALENMVGLSRCFDREKGRCEGKGSALEMFSGNVELRVLR